MLLCGINNVRQHSFPGDELPGIQTVFVNKGLAIIFEQVHNGDLP